MTSDLLKNNSDKDFIIYLHSNIRNNNIAFSFFVLFFHLTIAFIPFIILRYKRLGVIYDLNSVGFTSINLTMVISLIFFMLSLIYFFKIINVITYPFIIKSHFYLHYSSEKYRNITSSDFFRENLLYKNITKFSLFLYVLTLKNKEFIHNYKQKKKNSKYT